MDTEESESFAMEKALSKLDALVTSAMANEKDPSAPEQLAADAEVALAAKQALRYLRAIQVLFLSRSAPALLLPDTHHLRGVMDYVDDSV